MYKWRTGKSCVFKNNVHLVFVAKYRKKVFNSNMIKRLEQIFSETCKQMDAELFECNGEEDHIHLLVSVPPTPKQINQSKRISKIK